MDMKYLFTFLWCFFCCCSFLQGQSENTPFVISEEQDSIQFSVIDQNGRLALKLPQWKQSGFLPLTGIELNGSDLILRWTTKIPKQALGAQLEARLTKLPNERLVGATTATTLSNGVEQELRTSLLDVTENGFTLNESYVLLVTKRLQGNFDCTQGPPRFEGRKQVLPIGTSIIGLLSLGAGELVYATRQADFYDSYRQRWEEGAQDGGGFLKQAEDARSTRQLLTIGGGLLLVGGGIWTYVRWRKVQDNRALFDLYCQDRLILTPLLYPTPDDAQLALGVHCTFRF